MLRPRLGANPEKTVVQKDTCSAPQCLLQHSLQGQGMERPQCPSTGEQTKEIWGVCVCVVYIFVYICVCMYIHTQWNIT